ncbi:hypothetical protein HYH03_012771 [Edaphochlamys debaryana]|uniref:Uncharacterized protein n=1 Tax=Edaphochlamys debaryana TaxID=47281 RepID=A0A835XS72_9CHLO|nr:hypothetical protein HYH03_012771 [Edaphochlamys debaryana]|eukprot:KAG2488774.1 hypothetical protein HYH03_012771 [Edaphochlamys debaryana]
METTAAAVPEPSVSASTDGASDVSQTAEASVRDVQAAQHYSEASTSGRSSREVAGRNRSASRSGAPVFLLAGAACAAGLGFLFRGLARQQKELRAATQQLRSVEALCEKLSAKEQALDQQAEQRRREREVRAAEIERIKQELEAAREACKQAASRVEATMSNLSVSETELRAARTQLNSATSDLALTRAHLESTQGELGLSRSANELMQRELNILRRQLNEANEQLEGYILIGRNRKNGVRGEEGALEDDLAPVEDWGY